jgi:hypothetical protein
LEQIAAPDDLLLFQPLNSDFSAMPSLPPYAFDLLSPAVATLKHRSLDDLLANLAALVEWSGLSWRILARAWERGSANWAKYFSAGIFSCPVNT